MYINAVVRIKKSNENSPLNNCTSFCKFYPFTRTIQIHTKTSTVYCFSLVDGSKKFGNTLTGFWKTAKSMFNQQTTAAGIGRKYSLVDQQEQQQQQFPPSGRSSSALPTNQSPKARDVNSSTNGHGKKGRGLAKVHLLDGQTTHAASADSADSDETITPVVHRKKHYEAVNEPRPRSYSFNSALLASDPTLSVPRAVEPGQSLPTSPRAARKAASFEKHQKQHQHQQQQQTHQHHSRKLTSPSRSPGGHVRPHSRKQSSSHSSSDSPATGCAHHKPESDSQPHVNPRPAHTAPPPASASVSTHQCSTASAETRANESAGGNDKQPSNDGTLVDDLSALAVLVPEVAPSKGHMGQRGVEQRPAMALEPQNTSESSLLNSKQQSTPELVAKASRAPATAAAPTPSRSQTPDSEGSSTNL